MKMVDSKGMRILIISWALKAISALFSSGVTIGQLNCATADSGGRWGYH